MKQPSSSPEPCQVFRCNGFKADFVEDAGQALALLDHLRFDLGVYCYEGLDFALHTTEATRNGRHLFTEAEAEWGNRLWREVAGVLGGLNEREDAVADRHIFNTSRFCHRHIETLSEVLDLAQYCRDDLREGATPNWRLGWLDFDECLRLRCTLFATHQLTPYEAALFSRLSYEAFEVADLKGQSYLDIMQDCELLPPFREGVIARLRGCLAR